MKKPRFNRLALTVLPVSSLVLGLIVAGCNNCEKLVEKICTDLGPEDCQVWKAQGLDQQIIPGGRKVNRACGQMMDDAIYSKLVPPARLGVVAYRLAEATKKQDKEAIQKLTAQYNALMKSAK